MENLRKTRLKQLANKVVGAALGLAGSWVTVKRRRRNEKGEIVTVCARRWKWDTQSRTDRPTEQERISQRGRFEPCQAIIMEYLDNYKTKETRFRRENRMLAGWSKADFQRLLDEAGQLHGIHIRQVSADYTSKQDSRTGLPGARCSDIPMTKLSTFAEAAQRAIAAAKEKDANAIGRARERDLVKLAETFGETRLEKSQVASFRIPMKGGELFVSANEKSPASSGIQADLNAAANVGIRGLLDPDWAGAWWYVPASLEDGWRVPKDETCSEAACLSQWRVGMNDRGSFSIDGRPLVAADNEDLRVAEELARESKSAWEAAKKETKRAQKGKSSITLEVAKAREASATALHETAKRSVAELKKALRAKDVMNLWHDPSTSDLTVDTWREHNAYWNDVESRVIKVLQLLRSQAGLPKE